jgi:hypothetical protein
MTAREAIVGVERNWASGIALGVCPTCGARGESHDRDRCQHRGAGRSQANGGPPAPGPRTGDELSAAVLAIVSEHGPVSGREVLRRVPRRAVDVRAALRRLEAAGRARRGDDGWRVT